MKTVLLFVWRSPVILFAVTLLLVIGLGALAMTTPAFSKAASGFFRTLAFFFMLVPLSLTLVGLLDCVGSEADGGKKLLWVVIMLLAPILGPLLWFACGKPQTEAIGKYNGTLSSDERRLQSVGG